MARSGGSSPNSTHTSTKHAHALTPQPASASPPPPASPNPQPHLPRRRPARPPPPASPNSPRRPVRIPSRRSAPLPQAISHPLGRPACLRRPLAWSRHHLLELRQQATGADDTSRSTGSTGRRHTQPSCTRRRPSVLLLTFRFDQTIPKRFVRCRARVSRRRPDLPARGPLQSRSNAKARRGRTPIPELFSHLSLNICLAFL
jgi:hypothetical protein